MKTIIPLFSLLLCWFLSAAPVQAQDIEAILAIQEIDTMLYSGPKDNRINWVIQNRGDSFDDKEDFTTDYENDLLLAFEYGNPNAQEPYAQYRSFFNLYTSWWPEAPDDDSGWSFFIIKELRDMVFLPWANEETGWATWFSTTKHGGGGGAGVDREARVGDGKMYGMGWETLLHEFGHTMPGLLDEYSASGEWSGGQCWETGNSTGQLQLDEIPWRLWIEEGTPLPTPYTEEFLDSFGAFEGAMTNYFGCHRPTARGCYMGAGGFGDDYGQELCSVCTQRVICFLYKYVNVIENPQPAENNLSINGTETLTFSVDVVKPEPNTQKYEWILNGEVIATDTESVELTFEACNSYELVFAVHDTTSLVRYDAKFDETYPKPYREFVWTIDQAEVDEYSLASSEVIQNADCSGEANGSVAFDITGGEGPYKIFMEAEELDNPVTDLAPGAYSFDIIDVNGCSIAKFVTVEGDDLLDPRICSVLEGELWTLSVEDANYATNDLTFLWSTGSTDTEVTGLTDGTYTVDVSTNNDCTVQREISLEFIDNTMQVSETIFATNPNKNNGKIYLDISQGRAPYTIEWLEKLNKDLTDTNTDNLLSSGTTWGHLPAYAFDNALNTKWLHAVAENAFIGYEFEEPVLINFYAITSADDVPERDPKNWLFQGSDDGTNWTTLDEQTDHWFDNRYERRGFIFENTTSYTHYRLFILENYGDIATQLQELEFIGINPSDEFVFNELAKDRKTRTELAAGLYLYTVKDANKTAYTNTVAIDYAPVFEAENLIVVQESNCSVTIETPNPGYIYYWFPDKDASHILHVGNFFEPLESGNFYIAAADVFTNVLSNNIKGFAVQVEDTPTVEVVDNTYWSVVDPDAELLYHWYDADDCNNLIHSGTTFTPTSNGNYYVAAYRVGESVEAIDPTDIDGMIIRMDAADLNGDGAIDDPLPGTSSLYGWDFTNGNHWANGNWFAFRSNYQNGLGVADFATIWLQRIEQAEDAYQTIIMAYEENPISFPERGPFEGLSENIPKHSDASQLYSNNAPDRTLNGTTFLNGQIVDPLATENPMEFCILGTIMTEPAYDDIFYTDTHWEGKIGEVILYDEALSETEMKGVSEYLRRKWISTAELESPRLALEWSAASSIKDTEETRISVYPNPTSDAIEIGGLEGEHNIQLLSSTGKVIQNFSVEKAKFSLHLHYLPAGLYFVRIESKNRTRVYVEKVLKQ